MSPRTLFLGSLVLMAAVVGLFETGIISTGCLAARGDGTLEFVLQCIATLAVLPGIYLSLKRFGATARIATLGGQAIVCLVLYYLFLQVSFAYLAIISVVAMSFAWPKKQ